jgi:hypothetical protein
VSLVNNGQTAIFSGGLISAGDSLDTFLGIVVTNPSQPFTIDLTASAVPEPSSMFLAAIGVMVLWAKRAARLVARNVLAILAGVLALAPSISNAGSPQVVPAYQNNFSLQAVGTVPGLPAQMTFGPSGLLYIMTVDAGPISFVYNPTNGRLSSPIKAAPRVHGIGIAFHGNNMYLTSTDGSIHKLNDANGNGVWGEVGELAWITDLSQVVDQTGSANAFTTEPPVLSQALIQNDAGPFTTVGAGKLVVHSAGTRRVLQRILATGVFVAGLCEAGGSRWAGVTDPGYSFRERMPESVGAPRRRALLPHRS